MHRDTEIQTNADKSALIYHDGALSRTVSAHTNSKLLLC